MSKPLIYVASAGTGKSTQLLNHLEEELKETHPSRILFTTFTNAGATELATRAIERFPQYTSADFRYFRTLHSVAYRNIPNKPMIKAIDKVNFGRIVHYPISGGFVTTADGNIRKSALQGDILMMMSEQLRTRRCAPSLIIQEQTNSNFSTDELIQFTHTYNDYREKNGKYDFCDQLEVFDKLLAEGKATLPVDHVFVDEAQDLSNLQWSIIERIAKEAKSFVVAGDDKQSIYEFSGANPQYLIDRGGDREVLGTSYRLSEAVMGFSEGVAAKITKKQPYTIQTKPDAPQGRVQRIVSVKECDMTKGSWFILTRNRFMMPMIEDELIEAGIPFISDNPESKLNAKLIKAIHTWKEMTKGFPCSGDDLKEMAIYLPSKTVIKYGFKKMWDDLHADQMLDYKELEAEYGLITRKPWDQVFKVTESIHRIVGKMDAAGQLDETPRVRVATIHGVKGQEADNVIVFTDISYQTDRHHANNPDSEHRVFYVAVTRARENLFIHEPFTKYFYNL